MQQSVLDRLTASLPDLNVSSEIKRGGQKVVFRATYRGNVKAVFKVVMPQSSEERERALREIAITSELGSPLFARIHSYGEFEYDDNSVIYVIEELIPGSNLRDLIQAATPGLLPHGEARRIISSVLNALEMTEARNLVHRDIKPENIMVTEDRVVLIDFGIARHLDLASLTNTWAPFGPMTPGYAPPEQVRNEKRRISIRTDFFSLAVVTYELLTGFNPFIAGTRTAGEAIQRVLTFNPPHLSTYGYHESFDLFVGCAMSKYCNRRPANVAMAKALFAQIQWEA
ncbi:MAG: serine/threonine-protein kinase [Ignavibacteriales bacterium]|nr:serine/threonine-protein kinase [Ignavibacteriales bacterium]